MKSHLQTKVDDRRRYFRIRLQWGNRGEVGSANLSGNLIVQFGLATEDFNRTWYERNPGRAISAPARSIDRKHLPGLISDLAGSLAGAIANVADDLAAGKVR